MKEQIISYGKISWKLVPYPTAGKTTHKQITIQQVLHSLENSNISFPIYLIRKYSDEKSS